MIEQEMINKIVELAKYYASGGLSTNNPKLVNEIIEMENLWTTQVA